MFKKSENIFLIIILLINLFVITSALVIQYWLGHIPCKLCLYERFPYLISIILLLIIIFFKKYEKIILLMLSLTFIFSAALAFYHLGIEQGFFKESIACAINNASEASTKDQILEQLKQKDIVSCKHVSFRVLGFSLATINTIFSIILSGIFIKLFLDHGKN